MAGGSGCRSSCSGSSSSSTRASSSSPPDSRTSSAARCAASSGDSPGLSRFSALSVSSIPLPRGAFILVSPFCVRERSACIVQGLNAVRWVHDDVVIERRLDVGVACDLGDQR